MLHNFAWDSPLQQLPTFVARDATSGRKLRFDTKGILYGGEAVKGDLPFQRHTLINSPSRLTIAD